MTQAKVKSLAWHELLHLVLFLIVFGLFLVLPVYQQAKAQVENPQGESVGLQGVVQGDPPSEAAVITSPQNGETFTANPIAITGTCEAGLIVQIFRNGVFSGSALCLDDGTFTLQIDLVNGANALVARVFDALNQQGPDSNTVRVTFAPRDGGQIFFNPLLVTSSFGTLGADPGKTMEWPIAISGGVPPYAISWDWGDDSEADLYSTADSGTFTGKHIYELAGTYEVVIKVTDADDNTAYLQLVAVANGPAVAGITQQEGSAPATTVQTQYILWPLYALTVLVVSGFYLGRRYERRKQQRRLMQQAARKQRQQAASDSNQALGHFGQA